MKKAIGLMLLLAAVLGLTACATPYHSGEDEQNHLGKVVGLSVPNQTGQRWLQETQGLSQYLQEQGFEVLLETAQDDPHLQAEQLEKLIEQKVSCLVVIPIDSLTLKNAAQQAKEAGIPIIAYDRMLMNTDAVTSFVGFDSEATGRIVAKYIVREKQLETAAAQERSYTIEFFMGTPEDNSALQLYLGALAVLQPYLDSGVLTCLSGHIAFEDNCIPGESSEAAKKDCSRYLQNYYTETKPDIFLAAADSIAQGCAEALTDAGYVPGTDFPLITGQGAEEAALQRIADGQQTMTVYQDAQPLFAGCAEAIKAALNGKAFGTVQQNNGITQIPSALYASSVIDKDNYQQIVKPETEKEDNTQE